MNFAGCLPLIGYLLTITPIRGAEPETVHGNQVIPDLDQARREIADSAREMVQKLGGSTLHADLEGVPVAVVAAPDGRAWAVTAEEVRGLDLDTPNTPKK